MGKYRFNRLVLVAAVIGLAACGGGGGGGNTQSSSSTPSPASSTVASLSSAMLSSAASSVASPDTTPKDFDLGVPRATYAPEELATTNTVTITEIDALAPVTVSAGAAYSIDGGSYTSGDNDKIANNQTLTVRVNAGDTFGETLTVTVNVGTVEKTFQVVTEDADTAPEPFSFSPTPDADISTVYTSDPVTITGINTGAQVSVSEGGSFCIGDCSGANPSFVTEGSVANGETVTVRGESAATNATPKSYTLTIGGESADWSITTVADSTPPTAAIVFPTKVSLTDGTTLTVRGTAEDVSGITGVTVSVLNGDTVVGDPVAATSFADEGFARWTAVVTLTPEMENTLRVSATDGASLTNAEADQVLVTHKADYYDTNFPAGSGVNNITYSFYGDVALDYERNRILYSTQRAIISVDMATSQRSVFVDETNSSYVEGIRSLEVVEDSVYFPVELDGIVLMTSLDVIDVKTVTDASNTSSNVNIAGPSWMDFNHSDGFLYMADFEEGVYKIDISTGNRALVSGDGLPEDGVNPMERPVNIVLNESKNQAVVTDIVNFNMYAVDLDSGARDIITTMTAQPNGMEYDGQSRVFLSELFSSRLMLLNLDSEELSVLTDSSDGSNPFLKPAGFAYDQNNLLYFITGDNGGKFNDTCQYLMVLDIETDERVVMSKDACEVL